MVLGGAYTHITFSTIMIQYLHCRMQEKRIYFFIGTSAELIKIAPIIRELEKRKISFKIIYSGQNHLRFSDLYGFIQKQKADILFPEKKNKSSLYHFAFWAVRTFLLGLVRLRKEFKAIDKQYTYFIIHGDTISSLMGNVLAKIFRVKLVLIECGDLSFHLNEPFPEEICRNLNMLTADILFPPNEWAMNNVKAAKGEIINTKYNTLIESFTWAMNTKLKNKEVNQFKNYYILSLHRQENVIFGKKRSKDMLRFVIENANPKLKCLIISHPLTLDIITSLGYQINKHSNIEVIPQLPYTDFMKLMKNAEFIATDSAFNQLETYLMGVPYLGLRNYTEQIEGLYDNVVICKGDKKIMREFLDNYKKYKTNAIQVKQRPSVIIVDYLENMRK